jgi:hypothetical protein
MKTSLFSQLPEINEGETQRDYITRCTELFHDAPVMELFSNAKLKFRHRDVQNLIDRLEKAELGVPEVRERLYREALIMLLKTTFQL